MPPIAVALGEARCGRRRCVRVAAQPLADIVIIILLGPQHAAKGLALDETRLGIVDAVLQRAVEFVGLGAPPLHHRREIAEPAAIPAQPDPHLDLPTGRHAEAVMRARLGAEATGVDRGAVAGHDKVVDRILGEPRSGKPPQPVRVAFVVAEQQFRRAVADQPKRREIGVRDVYRVVPVRRETRFRSAGVPYPDVARPELRNEAQRRRIGAPVIHRQLHQDVVDAALGVFDLDVEITLVVEDPGIDQLELRIARRPAPVFLDECQVRERTLRIFIKHPHVGMGRRTVEIII